MWALPLCLNRGRLVSAGRGDWSVQRVRVRSIPIHRRGGASVGVGSDVEEADVLRVLLDEATARVHVIAHEDGEDLVGDDRIVEGGLFEQTMVGIHRRLPQLLVVTLAQALVALDREV